MKWFTIEELCASETARRKGIANEPPEEAKARLTALVENVLDPVREWWGKPVYVNSGYRSAELNAAVGGVAGSQHLTGEAADIDTREAGGNRRVFLWIEENLDFDQLIWENGGRWVHVSFRNGGGNRRQVLRLWKK